MNIGNMSAKIKVYYLILGELTRISLWPAGMVAFLCGLVTSLNLLDVRISSRKIRRIEGFLDSI